MKSTITKPHAKSSRPFPKLMIDVDGDIFYMLQENTENPRDPMLGTGSGVLIHTNCMNTRTGIYSTSWDLQLFQDFEGEITLSND
jgi:hypothetical protein